MNNFKPKIEIKMIGYIVEAQNAKHPCLSERENERSISDSLNYFRKTMLKIDGENSSIYNKATHFKITPLYEGQLWDSDQSITLTKDELNMKIDQFENF